MALPREFVWISYSWKNLMETTLEKDEKFVVKNPYKFMHKLNK